MRTCKCLLLVLIFVLTGCTSSGSLGQAFKQSFASLDPNPNGTGDGTDEADNGWIREAGIEARGDRPVEYENDPFRFMMSPKAKSIERNLGIQ